MVDRFELMQKKARVHFIPNLKVGVFVTLRTPYVIKLGEYGSDLPFPRARAPLRRDAAWLRGLVLAVIRGPILPIDSAARLIEIRNSSNQGALNPARARACHLPRARLP